MRDTNSFVALLRRTFCHVTGIFAIILLPFLYLLKQNTSQMNEVISTKQITLQRDYKRLKKSELNLSLAQVFRHRNTFQSLPSLAIFLL